MVKGSDYIETEIDFAGGLDPRAAVNKRFQTRYGYRTSFTRSFLCQKKAKGETF